MTTTTQYDNAAVYCMFTYLHRCHGHVTTMTSSSDIRHYTRQSLISDRLARLNVTFISAMGADLYSTLGKRDDLCLDLGCLLPPRAGGRCGRGSPPPAMGIRGYYHAVASEAICKWGGTSAGRKFFDVPPHFSLVPPPHMRGYSDCLLPTERQLKW